jgi:AcrR family transcriptional regulator
VLERLIGATARAVVEHGAVGLSVDRIARYAEVSEDTFYEHFAGAEQAFLATTEAFLEQLVAEVDEAIAEIDGWPSRVKAAVSAVLAHLAEVSDLARGLAIEGAAMNLAAAERQYAALDSFAARLSHGRLVYPRAASCPASMERALIGGVASILSVHLLAEEPGALRALEPNLVELLLTPYVGQSEARRLAEG